MKMDLGIIGQGVVSPSGVGVEALLHQKPTPISTASLRHPEKTWPVLRMDLKHPAFKRWEKEPRLRRASPITHYLVEAAAQALANVSSAERAETGLIVAFSAGCLAYSRRFFEAIVTQGQRAASPALFPETVFNSPVSHVAAVHGLNGAAYALVGDEAAWVAGLKTASVWLRQDRVKQVLVLGAEEFDPIVLDAYASSRWLKGGFLASEGAAGILVRRAQTEDALTITNALDGFIYRTPKEAAIAADGLWCEIDPAIPCYRSAHRNWLGSLEKKMTEDRPNIPEDSPYLGEAFTASAVWNTVRALNLLSSERPRLILPIWGINHQLGSLELATRRPLDA
jgi:hypothetical protein